MLSNLRVLRVTVAICTLNRSNLLEIVLDRFCQLNIPDYLDWELIVVDNNSNDETGRVLDFYSSKLPIVKIFENRRGLSYARNAAVRHATGSYILWTDDDVMVSTDWLSFYCDAFLRYPEASVFGGPVFPWFDGDPPTWLSDSWRVVADAYAVRDFGLEEVPLSVSKGIIPFGANFALKMSVQRKYRYNTSLGLQPGKMLLGEETDVITAALKDGFGWWVPDARVKHFLPKERQSLKYLQKYFEASGRTKKRISGTKISQQCFELIRWLFYLFLFISGRRFFDSGYWLVCMKKMSKAKGYVFG